MRAIAIHVKQQCDFFDAAVDNKKMYLSFCSFNRDIYSRDMHGISQAHDSQRQQSEL